MNFLVTVKDTMVTVNTRIVTASVAEKTCPIPILNVSTLPQTIYWKLRLQVPKHLQRMEKLSAQAVGSPTSPKKDHPLLRLRSTQNVVTLYFRAKTSLPISSLQNTYLLPKLA